jgi:serine/threonine protein kinase
MSYPEELLPNTLVDRRYRIQKTLGQGGFGRTYLVFDERRFNDLCVLKEFVPKGSEEYVVEKSRELFQREAAVLHHLSHPQIPGFLAQFEEEERLFLVQDYVNGKTYQDLLKERQLEGKTFNEIEVTELLKNLLPVLDYIHSRNIIHRDISPDNIMIASEGDRTLSTGVANRIMLIDFGVVNDRELTRMSTINSGNSLPGTTVGKIGFSPVEQIHQGKCYPNSDLYALAVTVLVLLSGKHPDELFDSFEMKWQWRDYISVSPKLGQILDKMLATVPQQRYQNALEVLTELKDSSNDPATICLDSEQYTTRSPEPTFVTSQPEANTTRSPEPTFITSQPQTNTQRSPEPTFITSQSEANTTRSPEPTFVTPQSQTNTQRSPEPTFVTSQPETNTTRSSEPTFVTSNNNFDSISSSSRPGAKTVVSNPEANNIFPDCPKGLASHRATRTGEANRNDNKINKSKSPTNYLYLALGSLAALLIGIVFIGMRSSDIAGICNLVNNCSNNSKAEKKDDSVVKSEIKTTSTSKPVNNSVKSKSETTTTSTPKPETEKTDLFDNPNPSPPSSQEPLW